MIVLLPRLSGPAADKVLQEFLRERTSGWAGFDANNLPDAVRFAATGGTRVDPAALSQFRSDLVSLAGEHGFGGTSGRAGHARFDARVAAWLTEHPLFGSGEALRDDVWTFIAVALAPDVVHWRFGIAEERYLGGVRNTFQRLWMRGRALDRGDIGDKRWELLDLLTEDALVQITERPSIGADAVLARAIAETWVRASRHRGSTGMELAMRRAILRVRVWNEIRSLSGLPEQELAAVLDYAFTIPSEGSQSVPGEREDIEIDQTRDGTGADGPRLVNLATPLSRIEAEAGRRGWLSPNSRAALASLRTNAAALGQSERNALRFLLERMRTAQVLTADIDQVARTVIADAD